MSLLTLPNELLLQVASYLDLPATHALTLTNHRLNSLLTTNLYTFACDTDSRCTTALYFAAVNQRSSIVSYLLDNGTDITISTPTTLIYHRYPREFDFASSFANILSAAPNVFVQDRKYGKTPLHYAAENGNGKLVVSLLDYGHPINIKDYDFDSALLAALKNNHTSIARFLINRGADIHAEARHGHTTFHLTAAWGHESIVSLMLDKGANLEATDREGHTVLHDAAQTGKLNLVKMLLRRGANINARVVDVGWGEVLGGGDTALHLAARRGHKEVVRTLIGEGADKYTKGCGGETASSIALERGNKDIVELLEMSRPSGPTRLRTYRFRHYGK